MRGNKFGQERRRRVRSQTLGGRHCFTPNTGPTIEQFLPTIEFFYLQFKCFTHIWFETVTIETFTPRNCNVELLHCKVSVKRKEIDKMGEQAPKITPEGRPLPFNRTAMWLVKKNGEKVAKKQKVKLIFSRLLWGCSLAWSEFEKSLISTSTGGKWWTMAMVESSIGDICRWCTMSIYEYIILYMVYVVYMGVYMVYMVH